MKNKKHVCWHLKANGERMRVQPKNGTDFSLEELQGFVGGYIEIVRMGSELMVVNDNGKLHNLPINNDATLLYNWKTGRVNDFIVGDVLLCHKSQVL